MYIAASAEAALINQYDQLKVLERENVLSEERERIMRDGIGGQLVMVITMLQEHQGEAFQKVREKVQHSLTDLRFVIDSLDPVLNDLPTLLGVMRGRIAEQLTAANINLVWEIQELPELQSLSPQRSLHIMRIVQEAVTNAIKHSKASKLKLSTGYRPGHTNPICISISDNGARDKGGALAGYATQESRRGIKNMYYRAQQINADLTLCIDGGTRVELCLEAAMVKETKL